MGRLTGVSPSPDAKSFARIDEIGGPSTYAHVNSAWAWASDTPFQWTKTVASHLGGTRNAMVLSWPNRIEQKGGIACHTGRHSCFFQQFDGEDWQAVEPVLQDPDTIYQNTKKTHE